jgi:Leucine-rich repeat (LRR) protein
MIRNLDVFFNNNIIHEIYIGRNLLGKKLTLKNMKNLTGLAASKNNLEEIDFTGTDNIKSLYLMDNTFKKIEFNNLLKLDNLDLFGNRKLKSIDISFNKALVGLYLLQTGMSQLNIMNNPLLETLYVEKNVKLMKSTTQSNFKSAPIIKQL